MLRYGYVLYIHDSGVVFCVVFCPVEHLRTHSYICSWCKLDVDINNLLYSFSLNEAFSTVALGY